MKVSYWTFLKKLLTTGWYRWETPETATDEKIVSTLYLDGDMLCNYPEDARGLPLELSRETLDAHLHKINRDLQGLFALVNHFIALVAILITAFAFALRPSAWLENLVAVSALSLIMLIFRKWLRPLIIKIIGRMLGRLFQWARVFIKF
jgi:hypothetical protein